MSLGFDSWLDDGSQIVNLRLILFIFETLARKADGYILFLFCKSSQNYELNKET